MTIKEIAELCGVDKVTVYRWVENQNFLSCKMQLRNTILEKIKKGSPERPSDFSLEETLAIIGDGGGNKTLAALLEENHALEAKKALKTHENSLLPLSFNGFTVRTLTINNEQWWVVKDVCDVLDIKNPRDAISFLDDDERGSVGISDGTSPKGGNPNMNIINESGLYTLILRSNKPEAKKFRKWVTSEVLPSIRKNGAYDVTGAFNDRLERMEKALEDIKKGQLRISAQPEITDPKTAMLYFGGKFLEITGKDGNYVEVQTLFKIFKGMFKVEIDSHKFMYELPLAFPEIRLDTRRKYKALFRGCMIK